MSFCRLNNNNNNNSIISVTRSQWYESVKVFTIATIPTTQLIPTSNDNTGRGERKYLSAAIFGKRSTCATNKRSAFVGSIFMGLDSQIPAAT